ncbi:hypothetical protein ACSZOO_03155 [Aeromonas hydrophila]
MIRIHGTMADPSGRAVPGAMIELRALNSTSEVLIGSVLTIKCDASGGYDFQLGSGFYDVYTQNDYQGDMDYIGTGAVSCSSLDSSLYGIIVDGGVNLTPPMLDTALDAMHRAESAATSAATDRVQAGLDAQTATNKAAAAALSESEAKSARDSTASDAADVRQEAITIESARQEVASNTATVSANTTATTASAAAAARDAAAALSYKDAAKASADTTATLKADVEAIRDTVNSNASTAVAAADTASQKAASAAQSEATASSAATRAEQAAQAVAGALIDAGAYDASTGVLPAPTQVAGVNKSCIWKVTGAGAVGGIELGVGDSLIYTTHSASYYKIDNTESVTSVNGQKGIVSLTASNVGADAAGTAAAAVLDAERRAVERASGGQQTVIYDAAGNANVMFVLPRFSYADLGMTADMGTGDVTAFDFGSGSIKSEIFIGAYLASGSGAVSAPRQDPRASLDHTAARAACSAKGAGWHLMTAHEWAAIALWCMANGYEPIGNTNWGRNHAKTWLIGDRADGLAPGDASGTGRTQTGSLGPAATHNNAVSGIADLVGNVWEWQDGFLLMDGRFKLSSFNTQAEANWAFVDAYLDSTSTTGGAPVLSYTVTNRLGTAGDSANSGYSASAEWKSMTKSSGYVSLQALRRLLVEPASVLPQGRIYMRNFGERLPCRGGAWYGGASAGLAALYLDGSRVGASTNIGFRPAFA